MSKSNIGIIGAGLSGLCAAKYAKSSGHSVTIFEQNSENGGTWIFTDLTDKDEYGLDIHSSMYYDLRLHNLLIDSSFTVSIIFLSFLLIRTNLPRDYGL